MIPKHHFRFSLTALFVLLTATAIIIFSFPRKEHRRDELSRNTAGSGPIREYYFDYLDACDVDFLWDAKIWSKRNDYPQWNTAINRGILARDANKWIAAYIDAIEQQYPNGTKDISRSDFAKIVETKKKIFARYYALVNADEPDQLLPPACSQAVLSNIAGEECRDRNYRLAKLARSNLEDDIGSVGRAELRTQLGRKFFAELRNQGLEVNDPDWENLCPTEYANVRSEIGE